MAILSYEYQYRDEECHPVTRCSGCDADWTRDGGITLVVAIADQALEYPTRLTPDGVLVDVDRLVANGYHSCTTCGRCGQDLTDIEGIYEESI